MLQTMANQRLSMADIIGHPWMLGTIADVSEVRQEFANRNQLIKKT